jgi:hypothetical protein
MLNRIVASGIRVYCKQEQVLAVLCEIVRVIKWVWVRKQSYNIGQHIFLLVESDHMCRSTWQARWIPRTFRWVLQQVFCILKANDFHIEVSPPPKPMMLTGAQRKFQRVRQFRQVCINTRYK